MTSRGYERVRALHHAIRLALLGDWDPIGVGDRAESQDEYDAYVPPLYELVFRKRPTSEIVDYLWRIETEEMGLIGNRERTENFAARLARLPEEVEDLREYRGIMWTDDSTGRAERITLWANGPLEARERIRKQYGDQVRVSVWNEVDANKPR